MSLLHARSTLINTIAGFELDLHDEWQNSMRKNPSRRVSPDFKQGLAEPTIAQK